MLQLSKSSCRAFLKVALLLIFLMNDPLKVYSAPTNATTRSTNPNVTHNTNSTSLSNSSANSSSNLFSRFFSLFSPSPSKSKSTFSSGNRTALSSNNDTTIQANASVVTRKKKKNGSSTIDIRGMNTTSPSTNTSSTIATNNTGSFSNNSLASSLLSNLTISYSDFSNAVTMNGFPVPSESTYKNFMNALSNSTISNRRELAMFFAQVIHESMGLQFKTEIACQNHSCPTAYDNSIDGKFQYYGRGYLMIAWSSNYAAVSKDIFGDENTLLQDPDSVSNMDDRSWSTAFSYWKIKVHSLPGIIDGNFGVSTNSLNGPAECNVSRHPGPKGRFGYYVKTLQAFHITDSPIPDGCSFTN